MNTTPFPKIYLLPGKEKTSKNAGLQAAIVYFAKKIFAINICVRNYNTRETENQDVFQIFGIYNIL